MSLWINVANWLALIVAMPRWLLGWARGRYQLADLAARMFGWLPRRAGDGPCLWLHAPSLGEVNVLLKLLPRIEQRWPEYEIVVTCSTTSGYQHARRSLPGGNVAWFPSAFSWAARTALERVRPTAILLVELELSPTFVALAHDQGVKLFVVNGRISDRQQRIMRAWPRFAASTLQRFETIFVQSAADAERFVQFGARREQVVVTGAIKFDLALGDRKAPAVAVLREVAGFQEGDVVFLAGSTKAGEEQAAVAAYRDLQARYPELKLVLVPRNASRFGEVARLLDASGLAWRRRSELPADGHASSAGVLLVDTVGELSWWWGLADIAFVGGSLHRGGGQNMIEPAAVGAAVCFGPHTQNFADVVSLLLDNEAAVVVRDGLELRDFVARCLSDADFARLLGWRARQVVQRQSGGLAATMGKLAPHLSAALEQLEQVEKPRRAGSPAGKTYFRRAG